MWQHAVETCHHWSNLYMEFLWLRWQTWFRMSSIFRAKSILVTMNGLKWKCTFHQWPPTELHTFTVLKFKCTHSFYFLKYWKYLTLTWTCYLLWSLYIVREKKGKNISLSGPEQFWVETVMKNRSILNFRITNFIMHLQLWVCSTSLIFPPLKKKNPQHHFVIGIGKQ